MDNVENVADSASNGRDNLEAIKGIGPNYSNALNKIGIRRYADLARYTPDELSRALLEKAGLRVPPERIVAYNWISQASELAQRVKVNSEIYLPEEARGPSNNPSLTQQAGFSLFFDTTTHEQGEKVWQTRVYHEESGEETIFQGVDTAQWVDWILERANLPPELKITYLETEAAKEPIPGETGAEPPTVIEIQKAIQLEILDVQISELGPSAERPEKQLMAEVRLHIFDPEAEALTEREVPFRIEIYLVDEKGSSTLVSSGRSELRSRVYEYISQQSFSLPELGFYELYAIVLLLPPYEGISYRRGPTFEVVP